MKNFLLNIGYVVLFAYAFGAVGLLIGITPMETALKNFITSSIITIALIIWRFFYEGYGSYKNPKVSLFLFFRNSALGWGIFIFYILFRSMILHELAFSNGVWGLAMVLAGLGNVNILPIRYFPYDLAKYLIFSFAILIIVYTVVAYFAYLLGIKYHLWEITCMIKGNNCIERFKKKVEKIINFIPFLNIYIIITWISRYFINPGPEKKLGNFFKRVMAMLCVCLVAWIIRLFFYYICSEELLNTVLYYVMWYINSFTCSLIAYSDITKE